MSEVGEEEKTPNPGSDEALEKGCLCPVLDNAHGEGRGLDGSVFWVASDCPIHGALANNQEAKEE